MKPKLTCLLAGTALLAAAYAQPAGAAEDPGNGELSASTGAAEEPFLQMLVVFDRDGNDRRYEVDENGEKTWIGSTEREFVPSREAFDTDVATSLEERKSIPGLKSRLIERHTFPDRPPEASVIHPSDYAAEVHEIDDTVYGGEYSGMASGGSQGDDP